MARLPTSHMTLSCSSGSRSSVSLMGTARGLPFWACVAELLPALLAVQVLTSASWWRSGMKKATTKANMTLHAPKRKGGPGTTSFYRRRENRLVTGNRTARKESARRISTHLCARCGSSCHRLHFVQLHVEQEEDEAVESRAQTIAQASDTCDHPLCHTWTHRRLSHICTTFIHVTQSDVDTNHGHTDPV